MTDTDLTEEHLNILKVLEQNPHSKLRDIHDELEDVTDSRFECSPDVGEGWNDERRAVRALRDELAEENLVRNEYQNWSLTPAGREIVSR